MRGLSFFLLIGGIACFPQQQGSGGGQPWWWSTSSGQDPSKPSDEKPAGQFGSGSYPGLYYSGTNAAGGDGSSSYGIQQQSGSQDSQHGGPGSSGPYQSAEESWSSSNTDGEDEPVFSPVEDEDQVYALKSRSRYNRKRLSFSQFRYTPTEPRFPQDPVFPHPGKGPQLPGMRKH